jgi:predicted PurR-regulated permease PerM
VTEPSSASPRPPSPSSSVVLPPPRSDRPAFFWLATVALIVAILARVQTILVPLALAIVVSFALSPAVRRVERALGRVLAVALVVLLALGAVSAFGYLLRRQLVDLSAQMSKYSDSIRKKVVALRGSEGSGLASLSKSVDKVVRQLDEQVAADQGARPVRVIPAEATAMERIETTLTPVVEPLARAVIVLVLVIFLLIKREDLRDRFIRLTGRGNVTLTTRTLDEAGQRISRFLTHQSAINGGFGIIVALGLFWIGIPYGPLWGFVAAVLRFVPFVGTLLAMLLPAALAFAQLDGWWPLLATLSLFVGLDILAAYVVEPVVIGAKTGVSSMAMLISAIFWSWLWGPVGLVLSTPLTVCLAVLGKHVPRLSYLAVMLGDEPALEDELILYQRLLAGDEEEAQEILEKRFRSMPRGKVFDEVVIPVLLLAGRDRARNQISEADHQDLLRTIRALVDADEVPRPAHVPAPAPAPATGSGGTKARSTDSPQVVAPQRVLGVSARTVTDEIIWEMLAQLFDPTKVQVESVGSAYLASEVTVAAAENLPDVVCIISIPPGGLAQARYICRRLRAKLPKTPILVIRPGVQANAQESAQKLTEDGATYVSFTLEDAHTTAEQQLVISQITTDKAATPQ